MFEMWFNGNAGKIVQTNSDNELEAARCLWPWDNRAAGSLFIWVRRIGTIRAICVELNTSNGDAKFANHPANRLDS